MIFKKVKHGVLFGLSCLISGYTLNFNALQNAQANEHSGGIIYYNLGTQWLNTNSLNQNLKSNAYSQSESLFWGQGGGINGIYNNFLVGLEHQSLFGQTTTKEQESLGISANYSLFQLGYLVLASSRFQLYPYIGIGSGQIQLYSTESLDKILPVSQGSTPHLGRIQSQSWLFDFGLGSNFIVPMSPTNKSDSRGLALGLKAGYLWQPFASSWEHNQLPMQGPEKLNLEGFYLKLQMGFGGYK